MVWSGARIHGDITCELCHQVIHTKAEVDRDDKLDWLLPPGWSQPGHGSPGKARFFCPRPQCREQAHHIQVHNYGGILRIGDHPDASRR